MNNESTLLIYAEQIFIVGSDTFVDCIAENGNAVVFEDNEETGYFYAVKKSNNLEILDALHIYNVADVVDKQKPSIIKILWTKDLMKALLLINNYYHAVFDFKNKAGYCRNGFPGSNKKWVQTDERFLTDELVQELAKGTP
jgi:hypothetical protein